MIEFDIIKDYVKEKRIAMVGNCHKMLEKEHGEIIDNYDVVIRMNKGSPKGKEKLLGTRTDILGVTTPPSKQMLLEEFSPDLIFWLCLNLGTKIPDYIDHYTYSIEYSKYYWPLCHRLRNPNPSTGMQLLDIFLRHTDCVEIALFGYDFCETHSWYANRVAPGAHDLGGPWPAMHLHEKTYAKKLKAEFDKLNYDYIDIVWGINDSI